MPNTYCGVRLPRTIAFMDLRGEPISKANYFNELLGLKDYSSPISLQWYYDLREASESDVAKEIKHMRRIAAEYLLKYRKALRNPAKPGKGGSAYYKPKAIYIANYGGSLICDTAQCAIRGFQDE